MATFIVTTATDVVDAGDGLTSLREAVISANAASDADAIIFDASLSGLTIILGGSQLTLSQSVTIDGDIDGDDKADITISGGNASRIFNFTGASTDVNLHSLNLIDGNTTGNGGAIKASNNSLTITHTTISGSTATVSGGGLATTGTNVSLTNVLLDGNNAGANGGGAAFVSTSVATLINTTVHDNTADVLGGGIHIGVSASASLYNSTVSANQADNDGASTVLGGGINNSATLNLTNTVVTQNTSGGTLGSPGDDDISGSVTTATNSFIGTTEGILGGGGSNINGGGDAGLLALADNGGTAQTLGLSSSSALEGAGDSALLPTDSADLDNDGTFFEDLPLDANGNARIQGAMDIGAVEVGDIVVDSITDIVDGDYSAGQLSLREAVGLVSDGATIRFDASLSGQTIVLGGTDLDLTRDVTIDGDVDGDKKADITIDGNNTSRIFNITGATTDVDLLSLTLQDGNTIGSGGAITATSVNTLNIVDSTIANNYALVNGGGIRTSGTDVTLANVLLSGNQSGYVGGGLSFEVSSNAIITNTTINGNNTHDYGGGINADSTSILTLNNSTVANNLANAYGLSTSHGGGLRVLGTNTINNSVIAGNTSGGALAAAADNDVYGAIDVANNSFFGTTETITAGSGNINGGGDAGLAATLSDNGGTTQTFAIQQGSALIGAGDAAFLPADIADLDGDGNVAENLPLDVDGTARIQGLLDIGAVEVKDIVVDNIIDENDGDFSAGDLSLREALTLVGTENTISFDASLSGQTIVLNGTELALTRDVIIDGDIDGDDKADITIDGDAASRIFHITGGLTDVDLLSLTITNGYSTILGGGAIWADSAGTLDISNSTISNSTSTPRGGGIYASGTTTTLVNTLITGNQAGDGGGIISLNDTLDLVNTTIEGNHATNDGGGIYANNNTISLFNSTISGNTADNIGAGIYIEAAATVNLTNTVIAQNDLTGGPTPDDVAGTINEATNSFIGSNETITTSTSTTNNGGSAGLAATLADNGGTTQTLAILSGSALIDGGDAGLLPADSADLDDDGNVAEDLPLDANDQMRVDGQLDIGAVEFARNVVVDNIVDEDDGDFSAGDISLREAIQLVGNGGTITFDASLSGQTIVLGGTELALTQNVTIDGDLDGDNKADITISGNDASRVFNITGAGTNVSLNSVFLTNGFDDSAPFGGGGAILTGNSTTLFIANSTIANSNAVQGGGIYSNGGLDVINSTFSGNTSTSDGGAVFLDSFNAAFTRTFTNTTFVNNSVGYGASTHGGAIYNYSASLTIANSAFVNNSGSAVSEYVAPSHTLTIHNSVFASNTAVSGNPDILTLNGSSTVVVENSFFESDVSGEVDISVNGYINNAGDPLLGELLDNGGTTLTMSPLDGSPLIGAGSNALLPADTFDLDGDGNTAEDLPLDGRGGLRIVGGTVDVGAVEQIVDEVIGGTDGVNNIVGGLGDDILTGLAGADVIDGGAHGVVGDTASFAGSTGAVQVNLDAGTATGGHAGGDVLSNIENLIGSSFGDILTGNDVANMIDGALGNDTLNGLGGNDVLIGGFNQDTLLGGDGDDDLEGKEGNDIIDGGVGTDTGRFDSFGGAVTIDLNLTAAQNTGAAGTDTITNVENLIGGIGNDRFTGKVQVSVLEGGGGSDSLFGLGGDDILNGGDGNDNAQGGNGADTLIGGDGRDTLVGGAGIDILQGDADKDVIRGGDDEDVIDGGAGRDVLIGGDFTGGTFPGDGAGDTFVFSDVSHSSFGGATRDIIRDFEQTLDVIDLSAIDAITGGGDDAFTFIGTSTFSGTSGELRAFSIGGNTTVRADVDGDGTADLEIFLNGTIAMTAGDFVL